MTHFKLQLLPMLISPPFSVLSAVVAPAKSLQPPHKTLRVARGAAAETALSPYSVVPRGQWPLRRTAIAPQPALGLAAEFAQIHAAAVRP